LGSGSVFSFTTPIYTGQKQEEPVPAGSGASLPEKTRL
jgi:hypothetical protein